MRVIEDDCITVMKKLSSLQPLSIVVLLVSIAFIAILASLGTFGVIYYLENELLKSIMISVIVSSTTTLTILFTTAFFALQCFIRSQRSSILTQYCKKWQNLPKLAGIKNVIFTVKGPQKIQKLVIDITYNSRENNSLKQPDTNLNEHKGVALLTHREAAIPTKATVIDYDDILEFSNIEENTYRAKDINDRSNPDDKESSTTTKRYSINVKPPNSQLSEIKERQLEEDEYDEEESKNYENENDNDDDGFSELSTGKEPRFSSIHSNLRMMDTKDNFKKFQNQDIVPTDNSFVRSSTNSNK